MMKFISKKFCEANKSKTNTMFRRLHKNKSPKFGDKFDFKFSHFQALQVPKGWDKLVLSIVVVETGKTIAKSSEAPVRNGNCRWIENLLESVWIPRDAALKEMDECLIKLVVTMGSSSSGILGEASVDLANYMSSKTSVPMILPLKKCNRGTTLQLKVQCLTPRAKNRDEQWKDTNSEMEDIYVSYDEMENKSDVSDGTFTRSVGSLSSNHLDGASLVAEPSGRYMSLSPSGSRSFNSMESFSGRKTNSPLNYLSGITHNFVGELDSIGSQSISPYGSYSFNDASMSNHHASNQREDFNRIPHAVGLSPLRNAGSSKVLLEAVEVTVEELRAEARMWEQNAQKLMIDLKKVRQESLDQSVCQASLEMELSESHAQCDGLKQEIEQLKKLVEELQLRPTANENLRFRAKDMDNIINELEDEIKFQKELNANLAVQLEKTQESNIELLSILQELEETIAKQKMGIDDVSKMKSEFEVRVHCHGLIDSKQINTTKQVLVKKRPDTSCDSDPEASIFKHPIRDVNTETEEEDDINLEHELQKLQEGKKNLESTIQLLRESKIASICLDDLQSQMTVLDRVMDSLVLANRNLESKSSELENSKHEMEIHLHEQEEENVRLSQRISGLEPQLRYLKNGMESSHLELENSAICDTSLQDEIRRLEVEMEAQNFEMKQKLQSTAEGLIEESNLLHKSNAELRKQNVNLHEHCAVLEVQLGESEKAFSDLSMKFEALEEKYSSMLEEFSSKEKTLKLELDALLRDNRKHKDKFVREERLLNQMYMEKTVEVQNLQREITNLIEQVSATHNEKDETDSEAVLEVSHLRADETVLEAALQEVQGKLKLSQSKLDTLQMESPTKVQQLKSELTASRQNQEVLMADHEKLLNLWEDVKPNEEKYRSTIQGLELKLKASEYERLQLAEEISSLKFQLEGTVLLQDEVLSLKKSLNETRFENERLAASFQILYGDYKELKAKRTSFMQKISISQQAVSELEDCKRKKVALEEKVLRLEGNLTAIEALVSQDVELKNEHAQIKRENSQFQRRIDCLEKEKEECLRRAQALEEELKKNKEVKQDGRESVANLPHPDYNATIHYKSHPTLMEQEQNNLQVNEKHSMGTSPETSRTHENQRQVDDEQNHNLGRSQDIETDLSSKLQALENELADALEANHMYKSQLKSLLTKELTSPSDAPVKTDGYDPKASSFEAELKDLQERCFQMSLKYAEVQAQKEQLEMKLKSVDGRKWFF